MHRHPTPLPAQAALNVANLQSMVASQLSQVAKDLQSQMARQSHDFQQQLQAERDTQQMERRRLQLQHSQEMKPLKAAMTPASLPPKHTTSPSRAIPSTAQSSIMGSCTNPHLILPPSAMGHLVCHSISPIHTTASFCGWLPRHSYPLPRVTSPPHHQPLSLCQHPPPSILIPPAAPWPRAPASPALAAGSGHLLIMRN
jgi:hypothetical protein